jgi:hypothetical protein
MVNLRFHKKIYRKQAVQNALREFKHLAFFELKNGGLYLNVNLKKLPGTEMEEDLLADEFSNYVLGMNRI